MIKNSKLQNFFLVLFVFLLPTQLALHFWPSFAFVYGIRIDYLAPTIYLTDILFALYVYLAKSNLVLVFSKHKKTILILSTFLVVNCFFSTDKALSIIKSLKYLEVFFLFTVIQVNNDKNFKKRIVTTLVFSACFFSAIGIAQVFLGTTTGFFYLLGERSFNISSPGIALVYVFGNTLMRAYSTFSHPNSLAGYLVVVLLVSHFENLQKYGFFYRFSLFIVWVCLLLTFSFSAFVGLLFSFLVFSFYTKNKKNWLTTLKLLFTLSLFTPLFVNKVYSLFSTFGTSVTERLDLAFISGQVVASNYLFGSGLNTFIPMITKSTGVLGKFWLLQPVHNIFLLTFAELGFLGTIYFYLALFKKFANSNKFIFTLVSFVMVTGLLDHYWLTLQQNLLIAGLVFGLYQSKN